MTTVSTVAFLYSPHTKLAAISILSMDDAGHTAAAAAMGIVIVITSASLRLVQAIGMRSLQRRTQAWRGR
jgi:iron(III) transport system permease protein